MRPVEITENQIITAGKSIEAAGRQVTANALRTAVGAGNPKRLLSVWVGRSCSTPVSACASPQTASGALTEPSDGEAPAASESQVHYEAHLDGLREQLKAMATQLANTEATVASLNQLAAQKQLIVDALSDELHKYKLRCAAYEGQDRQQKDRIADLIARVDEQRSELNRGAQNRATLERVIDKLSTSTLNSLPHE